MKKFNDYTIKEIHDICSRNPNCSTCPFGRIKRPKIKSYICFFDDMGILNWTNEKIKLWKEKKFH